MNTRKLTVSVESGLYKTLKLIALERDMTLSQLTTRMIENTIEGRRLGKLARKRHTKGG